MTPTSCSDRAIGPDDYLLYLRCPRSLSWRLGGRELPPAHEADRRFVLASERSALRSMVRQWFCSGGSTPAGSVQAEFDVLFAVDPVWAQADVWHPRRPEGMAAVLIRDATGVKEHHLAEAAFLRHCIESSGSRAVRLFVYHLNAAYEREEQLDPAVMFTAADVTNRVRAVYDRHAARITELRSFLARDPFLERFAGTPCARERSCPVCSRLSAPLGEHHVSTLHRGGRLVGELMAEGFSTITEVPGDRLESPRHGIQRQAVVSRLPHVDRAALRSFLARLRYPVRYLDFEAFSSAVPPFHGTRPFEHVPYQYSVQAQAAPGGPPVASGYLMTPGADERDRLAGSLAVDLGHDGSIVVYNAAFERAILHRLAHWCPAHEDALAAAADRIVDLLDPFDQFAYYHHAQAGKVSLKSVLPALTAQDYSHEEISDGYTANRVYRYLAERRATPSEQAPSARRDVPAGEHGRLTAALRSYCEMDTTAMVRIVAALERLAGTVS